MKLTVFLFAALFLMVSAKGVSQQVTLSGKNLSLEKIFKEVKKQTGYFFLYSQKVLGKSKPVDLNVQDMPLTELLELVFKNQPLKYTMIGSKTVNVSAIATAEKPATLSSDGSYVPVKGKVLDSAGRPLSGATVTVKNSKVLVVTDGGGMFSIEAKEGDMLVVSYVGYEGQSVVVTAAILSSNDFVISLKPAVISLEGVEVVSTGYQDIPKERVTGSFVQLDNKLLNRTVSSGILDRIINIASSLKAEKGGRTNFTIRGFSTINANMKPLVVIDGFPYDENLIEGDILLNNLNPNDVESITILRDAASASIWGARSGNGVIVIKTKRGRYNKNLSVQLNANVNFIEKPDLKYLDIMSSKDAVDLEKSRFTKGEFDFYDDLYPLFGFYVPLPFVTELLLKNRRKELSDAELNSQLEVLSRHDVRDDISRYLLQTGINQQYYVNVNGGGAKNAYYVSLGYDQNRSSTKGNSNTRYSFRFDNTFKPINQLEFTSYISYTQTHDKLNGVDYRQFLAFGQNMATAYTRLADENGNALHVPTPATYRTAYIDTISNPGLLDWHYRPLDELKYSNNNSRQLSTRLGGVLKYRFVDWISAEVRAQYEKRTGLSESEFDMNTYTTRNFINTYMYQDPSGRYVYPIPRGSILRTLHNNGTLWNFRSQLNINKSWNRHRINSILAYESSETKMDFSTEGRYGYNPEILTAETAIDYNKNFMLRPNGVLGSGKIPNDQRMGGTVNRLESFLGNAAYTFNDKYTVSASGRIDKSNFLGAKSNQRAIPLWSSGISWNISDEHFYAVQWMSYLKLRATYGYNGNLNNRATALPTALITANGSGSYHTERYLSLMTPPNPGLTWEKVGIYNLGADFRILNNRIDGSLEYYRKKGVNLIGTIITEPTTGVANYTGNYASMKGSGIDLILNTANMKGAFNWNSNFVFSYNTDKITQYEQTSLNTASYITGEYTPIIGKPVVKLYAFPYAGLNPENGDPMGYLKGEKTSYSTIMEQAVPEDLVYMGSITPRFFGNLVNTIGYKGISLSFNLTYKFKYYFRRSSVDYYAILNNFGGHSDYALRWQKPGDENVTSVPSFPTSANSTRDNFYKFSDILIERGDHIRLQDIKLSYDLGKDRIKSLPFSNASIYAYVNNVGILWSANRQGLDPDLNGYDIPVPRSIAVGVSVNF